MCRTFGSAFRVSAYLYFRLQGPEFGSGMIVREVAGSVPQKKADVSVKHLLI